MFKYPGGISCLMVILAWANLICAADFIDLGIVTVKVLDSDVQKKGRVL